MIPAIDARLLLAGCCLLALATSASAEGAWVLWSQEVATEPGLAAEDKKAWRPIATFETKSSCFSDASTKAEELADMLRLSDGTVKGRKIEVQRLGLGQDHLGGDQDIDRLLCQARDPLRGHQRCYKARELRPA